MPDIISQDWWALIQVHYDPVQEVCVCVWGGGGGGGLWGGGVFVDLRENKRKYRSGCVSGKKK